MARAQVNHPVILAMMMALVALSAQLGGVRGQGPAAAPAPAPDCFTILATNLSDCLTYVEPKSNLTKPDKACCPGLSGLVDSVPQCLCQLLSTNASSFGIEINQTLALALPGVCKVSTPSVSLCSLFGVPVASPVAAQGPMAPGSGVTAGGAGTPTTPGLTPAAGGSSETSPPRKSGSSCCKLSAWIALSGAFTALVLAII